MENDGNFSLGFSDEASYHPWEFESCSETGYLLGDPFCLSPERDTIHSRRPGLAFVLNKQSVLRVSSYGNVIEMLQLDELTKDSAGVSKTTVRKVVFSLNGDTLFVIAKTDQTPATLMAWDVSSGLFKAEKSVFQDTGVFFQYTLVAVREGVLLQTSRGTLKLWNFEFSECIRSWTDLEYITEVIPISEERVACVRIRYCELLSEVRSEVIILDTTREGFASTITIHGDFVACNSKCHVITTAHRELQMQCGDVVLWKISQPFIS
jgi:WD40 repeat protein